MEEPPRVPKKVVLTYTFPSLKNLSTAILLSLKSTEAPNLDQVQTPLCKTPGPLLTGLFLL